MSRKTTEREHKMDDFQTLFDQSVSKLARLIIQSGNKYSSECSSSLLKCISKCDRTLQKNKDNRRLDPERIKFEAFREVIKFNGDVLPFGIEDEYNETQDLLRAVEAAAYTFIRGEYVFDELVQQKIGDILQIFEKRRKQNRYIDLDEDEIQKMMNPERIKLLVLDEVNRLESKENNNIDNIPPEIINLHKELQQSFA